MATGANSTPLGRLNPVLQNKLREAQEKARSLLKPSYSGSEGSSSSSRSSKREHANDGDSSSSWADDRKKKRRSRWGASEATEKTTIPGMPTILPANITPEQERCYLLQLQIEDVGRKLRTGELGLASDNRSPSPEPIYNSEGKRLNTREYRTRKRLEEERHSLIQEMIGLNPDFKPPGDYKAPMIRINDRVMIPQEEHPEINFVGLLIGPRGNTLKQMEKDTGAKIIIRGKGSVKEGKVGRKDGQPLPGEDEPLHAYITGTNPESVRKAIDKVKEVIRQGVEVPEGDNDLRRMQLRELALLNGTLREGDNQLRCANCGAVTHKTWQCPDKPNITNSVVCTNCGGAGHIAKDCRERRPGSVFMGAQGAPAQGGLDRSKIDEEYMSLMAELGEGEPPASGNSRSGGSRPNIPSLFDSSSSAPRALLAPPGMQPNPMRPSWQQPSSNNGQPIACPPPLMGGASSTNENGNSASQQMPQGYPPMGMPGFGQAHGGWPPMPPGMPWGMMPPWGMPPPVPPPGQGMDFLQQLAPPPPPPPPS